MFVTSCFLVSLPIWWYCFPCNLTWLFELQEVESVITTFLVKSLAERVDQNAS